MTEDIYKLKITLGTIMIFLGIITWIATYKYVIPSGSIILTICGTFLIIIRNYGIQNKEK